MSSIEVDTFCDDDWRIRYQPPPESLKYRYYCELHYQEGGKTEEHRYRPLYQIYEYIPCVNEGKLFHYLDFKVGYLCADCYLRVRKPLSDSTYIELLRTRHGD